MMRLDSYIPGAPLSDFVDQIWYAEGASGSHSYERLLPDGSMELVINLREDELRDYDPADRTRYHRFPGAIICGARTGFMVIDTASQDAVMGVHFKPGGAFPFLGIPAREICNATVALCDVWGSGAGDLRERLLGAQGLEVRFRMLEQALLDHASGGIDRHGAVSYALKEFQTSVQPHALGEVTARIGLSSRRFIEVFSREVGLTPKRYCRVRRFQEAVRRAGVGSRPKWADLAVSCGYFDQAHFIHDFREFCGLTPAEWFGQRGDRHPNHVPIRA
jgi:AraC-like DNA-binding protein